jgi:hypothetical protein
MNKILSLIIFFNLLTSTFSASASEPFNLEKTRKKTMISSIHIAESVMIICNKEKIKEGVLFNLTTNACRNFIVNYEQYIFFIGNTQNPEFLISANLKYLDFAKRVFLSYEEEIQLYNTAIDNYKYKDSFLLENNLR